MVYGFGAGVVSDAWSQCQDSRGFARKARSYGEGAGWVGSGGLEVGVGEDEPFAAGVVEVDLDAGVGA